MRIDGKWITLGAVRVAPATRRGNGTNPWLGQGKDGQMRTSTPGPNRLTRRQAVAGAASLGLGGAIHRGQARQASDSHVQVVVSAHEDATRAGLAMLEAGGTAADAAIAIASVLSVVEGYFSSVLGGGTWALYYEAATGEVTSLDGVGPTGTFATLEDYEARSGSPGIHQSVVPGAWDGWMLWLGRYGRLDLGEIMAPAITLARDGFTITKEFAYWLDYLQGEIRTWPDSYSTYAPNNVLPVEGDTQTIPDLAATFSALVDAYNSGLATSRAAAVQAARDYYYRGPIAEALVEFSVEYDGYFEWWDFAGFEAEIVDPISISYRDGLEVYQNPPNSQGIAMLLALNILKGMDLADYGDVEDPDAVHAQIEAMKLAFADRYHHIGDPALNDIPLEMLLSDEYAAEQRERIDMNRAIEWPIDSGIARRDVPAHTTTFSVVDAEGNAAVVTTSLGAQFVIAGNTGIHMNNRMRMLSVEPGNPNVVTPGYKVRHTSCPYLVTRDGRPFILGGNTGADTQTQCQLQQFISMVEFGLSAQEAVDQPRWVSTAFPSGTPPWVAENTLRVQRTMSPTLMSWLNVKGHDLDVGVGIFGQAQAVILDEDGHDADAGVESSIEVASAEVIPPGE